MIILSGIRHTLASSSNPDRMVLWAIACTAFFGFFRLGELLPASPGSFCLAMGLTWGDVAVDSHTAPLDSRTAPRMIQIHLRLRHRGGTDLTLPSFIGTSPVPFSSAPPAGQRPSRDLWSRSGEYSMPLPETQLQDQLPPQHPWQEWRTPQTLGR